MLTFATLSRLYRPDAVNAHGEVFVLAKDDAEDKSAALSAHAAFNRSDPSAVSDLEPDPQLSLKADLGLI